MALIERMLRRVKDHLREGRIDSYTTLALRSAERGNGYRMVYWTRLMHVEMAARSDEQLARMAKKQAKAVAKRQRGPSRV